MELIKNLTAVCVKPNVATIGFFDGVHRGHQFLINQVKRIAEAEQLASSVITFTQHPRKVMQQDYQPQMLSTVKEKCALLAQQGLDYTVLLDFNRAMSQLTARDFMQQILFEQLGVRVLVIGYDHRFGHNRAEVFDDYARYGQEMGIKVVLAKACRIGDVHISSSVIRALVTEGDMEHAAACLGYFYRLSGGVMNGHKVGRQLGFPTANIRVDDSEKLLPCRGVYAVWVEWEGKRFKGMLNIGRRPTINNGDELTVEVHLLRFFGNLYNQQLTIEFVRRVRDELKFRSSDELVAQLKQDAEDVDKLLKYI